MSEDKLTVLKKITPQKAEKNTREQAFAAAMSAFYDEQMQKKSQAPQGNAQGQRPKSISKWIKGLFDMENRVPLTAALTGLLILPLGFVLYQNTALTPISSPLDGLGKSTVASKPEQSVVATPADPAPQEIVAREDLADIAELEVMAEAPAMEPVFVPAPMAQTRMSVQSGQFANDAAVSGLPMPSEFDGDQFDAFDDAAIKSVVSEPVSTFSIDVDRAAYAYMRNAISQGFLPHADAVRVEELINYFDYDYARPESLAEPFATDIESAPSPWDAGKKIVRIGVQGYEIAAQDRPAANLVFLIDTSGSMNDPDKLPLLVKSFSLMLDGLHEDDTVSIVAYAGSAGVVLEATKASDEREILAALRNLSAGGSTAGGEGIALAYQLAQDSFKEDGVNQVILATDGDFNVGLTGSDELTDFIAGKRDEGVFLSVLGFGSGNLNDAVMQALAQNGNGAAYFIDSLREAQSVLVDDLTQTLVPIAKDVKIQVEFNPAQVAEYRLIGYETRALNREDFNNDKVDAGDTGAGANVTAIYEVTPVGSPSVLVDPLRYGDAEAETVNASDELGFFKLRYKLPNEESSRLIEVPLTDDFSVSSLEAADENTRFALAVASFGQKLRGNSFVDDLTYEEIADLARGARGEDEDGYRAEFIALVELAAALSK